jgi:hypothetical protein
MRRMLHDDHLRKQLSTTARASITSRFSWEAAGDRMESLYDGVVRTRRARLQTRNPA